tara:strand:+ start:2826 stop:3557 length:732 start_codon:yes stop_codon:yes gene_type:complete
MISMREAVNTYLNTYNQFQLYGTPHVVSLLLFTILVIWLPLYARKLSPKVQDRIGAILGITVMLSYLSWPILEMIGGSFQKELHLPFHLCRFANLALPIVMLNKNYRMYEILFFWGLSGMLQGVLTPDIKEAFPHYHFIRFWLSHQLMIVALIYATVVYKMVPTLKSLWRGFIALNLFLLITIPVNLILDANYFWICGKPPSASLLDYMGPWPWYILTGEFVALAHFSLAYLPVHIWQKFKKS